MGNLGLYQWFTTTAKKVGGADKLIAMFVGGGVLVGSALTNICRNIMDKRKTLKSLGTYSVIKDIDIEKINLSFKCGDKITVFAIDNDAVLIIKNGDQSNPFFISIDVLKNCTTYKAAGEAD